MHSHRRRQSQRNHQTVTLWTEMACSRACPAASLPLSVSCCPSLVQTVSITILYLLLPVIDIAARRSQGSWSRGISSAAVSTFPLSPSSVASPAAKVGTNGIYLFTPTPLTDALVGRRVLGTLLNALFSTRFETMDATSGRHQTTLGLWYTLLQAHTPTTGSFRLTDDDVVRVGLLPVRRRGWRDCL